MTKDPITLPHLLQRRVNEKINLKAAIEHAHRHNLKIYYLDEANFTSKDFKKKAWSRKNENVVVDFQRAPPNVAASAIISSDGLYMHIVRQKSIKGDDHIQFLKDFREKLGHWDPVALYSDGLSFHHSKVTKEVMQELNIFDIKAIAYSAKYQPVEWYW
jgi:hypothetical protein